MKSPIPTAKLIAKNWPREWWHCKRKIKYASRSAAGRDCRAMRGCNPYRCDYCDGWHIGHPVKRARP